jgi:hypothetical protein
MDSMAIAALMYLVRNINVFHNPVPDLLDLNPDSQFLVGEARTKAEDNADVLGSLFQ